MTTDDHGDDDGESVDKRATPKGTSDQPTTCVANHTSSPTVIDTHEQSQALSHSQSRKKVTARSRIVTVKSPTVTEEDDDESLQVMEEGGESRDESPATHG